MALITVEKKKNLHARALRGLSGLGALVTGPQTPGLVGPPIFQETFALPSDMQESAIIPNTQAMGYANSGPSVMAAYYDTINGVGAASLDSACPSCAVGNAAALSGLGEMSDTTKYLLIGGALLVAGFVAYKVFKKKR